MDYQRLIGIMGLSPLRGSLRAAPGNPGTEVSLYPTSPSWRAIAPHDSLASLLIAHSASDETSAGGRGGRKQVASREEERSTALTIQFSRSEGGTLKNALLLYNGHFFGVCPGDHIIFLKFFRREFAMSQTVDLRSPYSSAKARMVLSPRRHWSKTAQ